MEDRIATADDAINLLLDRGIYLPGELENIHAAYRDITRELREVGYTSIGFSVSTFARKLRWELEALTPLELKTRGAWPIRS